jgi:hypothetical protein
VRFACFLLCLCAALAVACGDGAAPSSTPTATVPQPTPTATVQATVTATVSPTPTPTVQPTPVAVPAQPDDFAAYPQAIADYLTAAGATALGPPCLEDLFREWAMPETGDPSRCVLANTDSDPADEIVVLLTAPPSVGEVQVQGNVVVFDERDGRYDVAFESVSGPWQPSPVMPEGAALLAASDINADGRGELAYVTTSCGAHTCSDTVHIFTGTPEGYRSLSGDGFSLTFADISLTDRDDDGVQELTMHGGTIGSIGAGPQRARTEVYDWDGTQYTPVETTYDPSNFLYLRLREADDTFAAGRYLEAADLYRRALEDASLDLWKPEERDELDPYALFRIALSLLAAGEAPAEAVAALDKAIEGYPGSAHGELAQVFRDSYLAREDLSAACQAARDYATANLDTFTTLWDYGYANPEFDVVLLCPM